MESKLFITCPKHGWTRLTIDSDDFWISYSTDFGYDFLRAVYFNHLDFDVSSCSTPRVVLFDTEEDGYFYAIFCSSQLTICSQDGIWNQHYFFKSARDLLDQVMDSMYPFALEWLTFYDDKEDPYLLDLFKEIKEEVYGQTV